MRGRPPKDQAVRQRRNRTATEAELAPEPKIKAASLTGEMMPSGKVHRLTRQWWARVWKSPIAARWTSDDIEVLYVVAILRNMFYENPTTSGAAEIRQNEDRIGLSMMGRKRFDMRITGSATTATSSTSNHAEPAQLEDEDEDPRNVLRMVR